MSPALRLIALVVPLALAVPAGAHPHIFVEAGLRVLVDARGNATGVEVTWEYDEFYSMVTFEDLGLDGDYDGVLKAEELAALDGFDLDWIPGYEGDLYLETRSGPVDLGPPEGRGVTVREGRIRSTHFRPLTPPVPAAGLVLRAYDPGFYTSYTLGLGVGLAGAAAERCRADVTPPDRAEADARLAALLDEMTATEVEADFPAVGAAYAETVTIRCGA